jgi:hypothetical protein
MEKKLDRWFLSLSFGCVGTISIVAGNDDDRIVPQRRAKRKKNSVGPNDELTFTQSFIASRSWISVMVAV